MFRATVFARDKGVCADCGLDCHALDLNAARAALWDRAESLRKARAPFDPGVLGPLLDALAAALEWRVRNNVPVGEPAWQVDHVVPLCRSGPCFEMSNLATRCVPCHRKKSIALNRELAAERAASRAGPPKRPGKRIRKRKAC